MPELMMRYRAAAFFARVYTPEITLGFLTEHEQNDLPITDTKSIKLLDTLAIKFKEIGVDTTKFFELTGIEWNVDNLDKIKDAYFSLKDSNLDKTEIK